MHAPYVFGFEWSDMVPGCMVYTECSETAAVHVAPAMPALLVHHFGMGDILKKKTHCKKLVTHVESRDRSESAREQRIVLYKSDHYHVSFL